MARLSFRCDEELVADVDEVRGDVARELWLRKTVQREVARARSNARAVQEAGGEWITTPDDLLCSARSSRNIRCALPLTHEGSHYFGSGYRQSAPGPNVENIRSSTQAKRGVQSRPKKGK